MQGTMMQYGLTLTSFLERAGKLFPGVEVISRLPDNSVRRSTYSDLYRRARALGASPACCDLPPEHGPGGTGRSR